MQRIIDVIEGETASLRMDPAFDVSQTSLLKNRLLLDLNRLAPEQIDPSQRDALLATLAANALELGAQLEVMRRRTALAMAAVRDDGHDGTYATAFGKRRKGSYGA